MNKVKMAEEIVFLQPFGYFNFLQKVHGTNDGTYLCDGMVTLHRCVKTNEYYNFLSFKSFVCGLIYNAVNMFPAVSEYEIEFKNNSGTSCLLFKNFEEIGEDHKPCLCKLFSLSSYEENQVYSLTLCDIKQLYCNNHFAHVDNDTVNTLIVILHMHGWEPTIKTSFVSNPKYIKTATKK